MAGAGAKTWSTGDVLTASDVNTYLMQQSIMVFATETTRDAALTSPSDGMFAYTTTTPADTLSYYNGAAWVAVDLAGDITGITTAANSSMAGGATSGTPSLTVDVNNTTSATATASDYVLIADTDDSNATKRALISDITALVPQGDLTGLTAGTNIDITSATGPVPTITLAIDAALATGADGSGVDVTFHSDTAGDYLLWDSSEEQLILEGTNSTTVLNVTDGDVIVADGTLDVSGVITATSGVSGNVTGTAATVTGAAQGAITSVGTLTALEVSGGLTLGSAAATAWTDANIVLAGQVFSG